MNHYSQIREYFLDQLNHNEGEAIGEYDIEKNDTRFDLFELSIEEIDEFYSDDTLRPVEAVLVSENTSGEFDVIEFDTTDTARDYALAEECDAD